MAEYKIIKQAETFRITLDGTTKRMRQILYSVGEDGPFQLEVPADEYDPVKVRALLEEDARRVAAVRGL